MIIFYLFNSVSGSAQPARAKQTWMRLNRSWHFLFLAFLIIFLNSPELKAQASNIGVNGFFSVDPAQQGSTFKGAIVLDIPKGIFVNSNKPLSKNTVPTIVKVEAPRGFKVSPVSYPRAVARVFSFSAERLAVFSGRAILRFNITVPANFELGETTIRVKVQYQSCSNQAFNSPKTVELVLPIKVVTQNTPIKRVNGNLFGTR